MAPVGQMKGPGGPEPTHGLVNWCLDICKQLLFDRKYFWLVAGLLLVAEALLGNLIIWRIPYTKIDWPAYMQQVDGFLAGERDYSKLEGDTGPLVYPALHLYIYTALHELLPSADRVRPAQYIFLGVYLTTFILIAYIYRRAGAPQILLIPLMLSKRTHSIYLLRLFNDPWAMLLLYMSVALFLKNGKLAWRAGCAVFSLALGVKMNILLFVPGLLVLLFQYRGIKGTIEGVLIVVVIQTVLPAPFFFSNAHLAKAYFTSAFDFSRQFLYEWTVNWRFVSERTFHSKQVATGLLIGHMTVLVAFAWYRWSPIPGGTIKILQRGLSRPSQAPAQAKDLPPHHIPLVLFTSNLIGITFARSLHYQFYSWYFHQLPLLLFLGFRCGPKAIAVVIWVLTEFVWSKSPATPGTSMTLLVAHWLTLFGLWLNAFQETVSGQPGTTTPVTGPRSS
ncbi:putative Dol-P-Man:Man(5)GlcNAc(2)-PP-Dol alpha-1,3-mannosyltransferase [Kockovaella imperatae]|uniref:Dol-P-Man:Man(5)GlcNAc(2)-PP-Dol alpha-1,3-mannosyltransferase n=1 Tax=Kockovaella imperatae TaxID=4999 RepID=A0A1Y1UDV8_9TREE|nr:putative Dol-P-Man:Man(5)GlcNAc(2)-PP-Dol alpha-1,3-mannosyltransferase [Kockovaella imperatae]ORX35727.1 putative Dol-P-Man:Man(5)GlcNAc(2)-PP-Dol alpha-1,3-mannosyltransferase [Kockovaella imperatae]